MLQVEEAFAFQQTWSTYLIITSDEKNNLKNLGIRKNSSFFLRLRNQVKHSIINWFEFDTIHSKQHDYFKNSDCMINHFIYKYFIQIPEL
jgi:hypothetical protein